MTNFKEKLWDKENIPLGVKKYLAAFRGEFPVGYVESSYPYQGEASSCFRMLLKKPNDSFDRFIGKGDGCWTLKRDSILNNCTSDILAAAECLGGKLWTEDSSGSPGGIGADSSDIWIPLLDGGVGVEVLVSEHYRTNRVMASQATTIRGSMAYRVLLETLGFNWVARRLPSEDAIPSHDEYKKLAQSLIES